MPIYTYMCKHCGRETFVMVRSMKGSERPAPRCECGSGPMNKVLSAPSVIFW